jgi:hypothetical protein
LLVKIFHGRKVSGKAAEILGFLYVSKGLIAAPYAASPLPPLGYLKASIKYIGF